MLTHLDHRLIRITHLRRNLANLMELKVNLRPSQNLPPPGQRQTLPQASLINDQHPLINVQQNPLERLRTVICQGLCGLLVSGVGKGYR